MGLEMVEIAMDVEKTFGVSLGDSQVAELRTVGNFRDYIIQILERENQDCAGLTNGVYEELRAGLRSAGVASEQDIRLDTPLSELIPFCRRKSVWRQLGRTTGFSLPPLHRPHWLSTIVTVTAIAIGWIFALSYLFFLIPPGSLSPSLAIGLLVSFVGLVFGFIAIFLLWLVGRLLTLPLAAFWPRQIRTIGDLAKVVCEQHYGKVVKKEQQFNREEVWTILQSIVAGVLGLDRKKITPESRFVEDLGAG